MARVQEYQLVTANYCTELYKLNGNYIKLSDFQLATLEAIKAAYEIANNPKTFQDIDIEISKAINHSIMKNKRIAATIFDHELRTINAFCSTIVYQLFNLYPPSDWLVIVSDAVVGDAYKQNEFLFSYDMILKKRNDKRLHFHIVDFVKDAEAVFTSDLYIHKFNLAKRLLKRTFNNYKLTYALYSFKDFVTSNVTLPTLIEKKITNNPEINICSSYETIINAQSYPKRLTCLDYKCHKRKECMKDV